MNKEVLAKIIDLSIQEDVGDGDHSSLSCIPEGQKGKVQLIVKEAGIIAGVEISDYIIKRFDPFSKIEYFIKDGTFVKPGDIILTIEGKVHSLLKTERLLLNVMQRMSGIATETQKYVRKLEGTKTKVLDTRKTTPCVRLLEKEAVRIGGGVNHRMGLYDMIMLKDNHIDFAGGIKEAISAARSYLKDLDKDLQIEIEVRNLKELSEVLEYGNVDRIMLDNFSIEDTQKATELINHRFTTESSGNITLDTIRGYAECGVNFVSVGALTHHVKSLDLSLKAV